MKTSQLKIASPFPWPPSKESPPKISAKLMQWPGTVRTVPWRWKFGEIWWWKKSGDHCLGYRKPCKQWDKTTQKKLLHDFFHQQHFEGMTVLGRIVSLTEWRETTWNYSEGGMVPIHPSCIQQGIYWYPHPNSIPISPGTRAAKVVYTQVGASIKETVRGHSRQIELCSVTWWCRLATVVTGCEKRGGWDRLKKRRSWLKKSERLCIYIYIIYIYMNYICIFNFIYFFSNFLEFSKCLKVHQKKGLGWCSSFRVVVGSVHACFLTTKVAGLIIITGGDRIWATN